MDSTDLTADGAKQTVGQHGHVFKAVLSRTLGGMCHGFTLQRPLTTLVMSRHDRASSRH